MDKIEILYLLDQIMETIYKSKMPVKKKLLTIQMVRRIAELAVPKEKFCPHEHTIDVGDSEHRVEACIECEKLL